MGDHASFWKSAAVILGLLVLGMLAPGNDGPTCTPISPVDAPCLIAADCDGQPTGDCDDDGTCVDSVCAG